MKHYGNALNLLTGAEIDSESPVASEKIDGVVVSKVGGGLVRGTGAYTGQADTVFDIEILNNTGSGAPPVSTPIFTGVGNAVMSDLEADNTVAAQQFTVTLADLGTETRSAYTPFQGARLVAKTPGADANYIQIVIEQSGITRTATDRSLLSDLVGGTNEYTGDEWDFGGRPRNPDGTLSPDTGRISFGDDPTVYRQYKVFTPAGYVYSFSPAPLRTVSRGAIVKSVTGGRTMTVTHTLGAAAEAFVPSVAYTLGQRVKPTTPDGHWHEVTVAGTASTEPTWSTTGGTVTTGGVTFIDRGQHTRSYSDIVTLFDALTEINSDAASLIAPVGPVVLDYEPNGMGITDLTVRTGAYVQSIVKDGSNSMRTAPLSVAVAQDAPTEELTIRCSIGAQLNREVFEVSSNLRGILALAITGVLYDDGFVSFTVPLLPAPEVAPVADKSFKFSPVDSTTEPQVSICPENFVLGALATPRSFTFRYEKRVAACDCETGDVEGGPNPIYLGIDPGVTIVDALHPDLKTRVSAAVDWFSDFTTSNTLLASASTSAPIEVTAGDPNYTTLNQTYSAVMTVDIIDIQAARVARDLFCDVLFKMQEHVGESGTIPTDATDLWDTLFATLQTDFEDLEDNAGAAFWNDVKVQLVDAGTGAGQEARVVLARRIFSTEFAKYIERYKAQMDRVYVAADIKPPSFGESTGTGTGPWTDAGGQGWFVATDSPLLPIQVVPVSIYYHSAIDVTGDDGIFVSESTQQFGIGLKIGCPELLKQGDTITITIGETGATTIGYQQGDNAVVQIVAGSPVQLGGGQIGNDTQTWSVVGSVAGALADYSLLKTSPPTYSDDGIEFVITPGGIPSRLGDRFVFWTEGGQFRWRQDGGSWSSATQIAATVSLADGVSAAFDAGAAPSFVAGDTFQVLAEAVNGGAHLQSLTYGGIVTTEFVESMVTKHRITIIPDAPAAASECWLVWMDQVDGVDNLEVGATVTVRGYTGEGDAEGTEISTGTAITNGSRSLLITMDEPTLPCAKFTVTYYATANTHDTLGWRWGFIGDGMQFELVNGRPELGAVVQRWQQPTRGVGRGELGVNIECTGCGQQSIEDALWMLDYAARNDDGRIGIIVRSNAAAPGRAVDQFGTALTAYAQGGIVATDGSPIEVRDIMDFQPANPAKSILSLTLELSPA